MPTHDATTVDPSSATRTSASFSHTCTGSDLSLTVITAAFGTLEPTVASATYNSVALTQRVTVTNNWSAGRYAVSTLWTLDGPATGSNTVAVTYDNGPVADAVIATSYTDANNGIGTNTASTTGNGSNPSMTFTTDASDGLIVAGGGVSGGDTDPFTPGTGTTERSDGDTGTSTFFDIGYTSGDESATGGSDTIDFTASVADEYAFVAIELNAAAGGAAASLPPRRRRLRIWKGLR